MLSPAARRGEQALGRLSGQPALQFGALKRRWSFIFFFVLPIAALAVCIDWTWKRKLSPRLRMRINCFLLFCVAEKATLFPTEERKNLRRFLLSFHGNFAEPPRAISLLGRGQCRTTDNDARFVMRCFR